MWNDFWRKRKKKVPPHPLDLILCQNVASVTRSNATSILLPRKEKSGFLRGYSRILARKTIFLVTTQHCTTHKILDIFYYAGRGLLRGFFLLFLKTLLLFNLESSGKGSQLVEKFNLAIGQVCSLLRRRVFSAHWARKHWKTEHSIIIASFLRMEKWSTAQHEMRRLPSI